MDGASHGANGPEESQATPAIPSDGTAAALRRQKAMSIGNAASLFGAPSPSPTSGLSGEVPEQSGDFFGGQARHHSPASAKSPFASIGEDQETAPDDNNDAANLFGAGGSGSGVADSQDWLGQGQQQQQPQASFYNNAGSNNGYDNSNGQQYNAPSDANYAQYATYEQPQATSAYYDPSAAQQYQGNLHTQAQQTNYGYSPALQSGANTAMMQGGNYASSGYDTLQQQGYQYAQQQQQPYSQNYPQSAAYGYSQQAQQQQSPTPYSAPAFGTNASAMQSSQSRSGSTAYAPSYAEAFDPYAPTSSSNYNPAQSQAQARMPSLTHSQTSPAISQSKDGMTQIDAKKLNRSASNFFAELPSLPRPKSRVAPASYQDQHHMQQSTNAGFIQPAARATPPPPPQKSRTPAPPQAKPAQSYGPPRPSSAASSSSAMAAAYGYTNDQRPGSRTQTRQDSVNSYPSSSSARNSFDQGQMPHGQYNAQQGSNAYVQQPSQAYHGGPQAGYSTNSSPYPLPAHSPNVAPQSTPLSQPPNMRSQTGGGQPQPIQRQNTQPSQPPPRVLSPPPGQMNGPPARVLSPPIRSSSPLAQQATKAVQQTPPSQQVSPVGRVPVAYKPPVPASALSTQKQSAPVPIQAELPAAPAQNERQPQETRPASPTIAICAPLINPAEKAVVPEEQSIQNATKDQLPKVEATPPALPPSTLQVSIPANALSPASSPLRSTSSGSGWDFDDDILDPEAEAEMGDPEPTRDSSTAQADAIEDLANTLKASSLSGDMPQVKSEETEEAMPSATVASKAPAVHVKNESLDVQLPLPSLQVSSPSPTPSPNVELANLPAVKQEEEDDEVLLDDDEAEAAWELDQAEAELELELATDAVEEEATDVGVPASLSEGSAAASLAELESSAPHPKTEDPDPSEDPEFAASHEVPSPPTISNAASQTPPPEQETLPREATYDAPPRERESVQVSQAGADHQDHNTEASLFSPYESSIQDNQPLSTQQPFAQDNQPYNTYDTYSEQPTYSTNVQNPNTAGEATADGYDNYASSYGQAEPGDGQQTYAEQPGSTYNGQYATYDQTESTYAAPQQDLYSQSQQVYEPQNSYDHAGNNGHPNGQPQQDGYYAQPYDQTQGQYTPSAAFRSTNGNAYDPYGTTQPEPQAYQSGYAHQGTNEASQAVYDPYAVSANYSGVDMKSQAIEGPRSDRLPPIPLAVFGLNGRMLTFFPPSENSSQSIAPSYGMAYNTDGETGYPVKVRKLADLLPTEEASLITFPGPLFMDSGATSSSGKAKKKKEVLVWLDAKIAEHDKAFGYGGTIQDARRREAEETVVLLRLVKVLLEHDGKVQGSAKIDDDLRNALLPHLDGGSAGQSQFRAPADIRSNAQSLSSGTGKAAASASVDDLHAIQNLLLKGNKREAVRYALDNKLWAHAFVIASGVDQETRAAVTKEFMQAELSAGPDAPGHEPLKVAYSLLTGSGGASIQAFLPVQSLLQQPKLPSTSSLPSVNPYAPVSRAPSPSSMTSGILAEYPSNVSPATLTKWRETAAIIIANRTPGDSQALTGLGDTLLANGWLKAAHACYLLSPQTSPIGGANLPGIRYSLLGMPQAMQQPAAARDLDAIHLTEVLEFALSFTPTVKGQEAYLGLPHLQAYKLIHARALSDLGLHSRAQKYCDAIGACLKLATRSSPYYHSTLLSQVKELSDRLSNVVVQDKAGSWLSKGVKRPTLDNVWSTLEGRFAKFVAGEAEEDPSIAAKRKANEEASRAVAGPFANYSSITPQGPDSVSRNASSTDLSRATPPPQTSSVPNTVSRGPAKTATHHRRSSSYGYGPYGADPYPPYVPQMPDIPMEETVEQDMQQPQPASRHSYDAGYGAQQYGYVTPQNDTGWWNNTHGASPYGGSSTSTPGYGQTPMFSPVAEESSGYNPEDANGLLSPMNFNNTDATSFQSYAPQHRLDTHSSQANPPPTIEEDDDELGLGNMSNKAKGKQKANEDSGADSDSARANSEPPSGTEGTEKKAAEKTVKPAASSSWLGRIFKRDATVSPGSGPIKAKLGEETSFVYDPVEKRWVNKKAGADTPPPAPVVPPPRAQTASPTAQSRAYSAAPAPSLSRSVGATPPPPRVGGTATPPAARSAAPTPPPPSSSSANTPNESTDAPPPRPSSTGAPPPLRRPATTTGASKKNIRSRYVDVFAQQQQQ